MLRSGEQVRITAQLIDARSDRHLWAHRYDRGLAHVLDIQSEVARDVASAIELALSPQQIARLAPKRPIDPRAQDAYFRGLSHRIRFDPDGTGLSAAAFEEAIAISPEYAPAYASLAATLVMRQWTLGYEEEHDLAVRARDAAMRAVELDPGLGDAHMALGVVHLLWDWDWDAAEREILRGRELGASDPVSISNAWGIFLLRGRPDEALTWMNDAVERAPLDLFVRSSRAVLYLALGMDQEALDESDRILAIDPEFNGGLNQRLSALEQLGRFEEAIAHPWMRDSIPELKRLWRAEGSAGYWGAIARHPPMTPDDFDRSAMAYAQRGDVDEAFTIVEQMYKRRSSATLDVIWNPLLAPLRADPRFADLLRRLNLPVERFAPR